MKLSKKMTISIFALIFAGLGVALYLTFLHYTHGSAVCGGMETFSNCDMVLQSKYAEVFNVPVALFGVVFYAMILIVFLNIIYRKDDFFVDVMFSVEIVGFVFSVLLVYTQIFLIGALCPYCLSSAIITAFLFFMSLYIKNKNKNG